MSSTAEARAAFMARADRQKAALVVVARLIGIALLVALGLRTFAYEPFNIPSKSMQPGLQIGDYLFVAKWPYGYGRHSLPLGLPLFEGRIAGALPARGDIIVFKTPRDNRTDFIKRVIGLPGDMVELRAGQLVLNNTPVPRQPTADALIANGGDGCGSGPGRPDYTAKDTNGRSVCVFPAAVETLPGGRRFTIIDQIANDVRDTTAPVRVPDGHVFVLGDNRDDSADSRFTTAEGGVGMVPLDNIIGRADRIFFAIDRSNGRLGRVRSERIGTAL